MTQYTDAELCVIAQTQGPGLEFQGAAAEREMVDRYWRKACYEARDFAESIVLVAREDLESAALKALLNSVRVFDPNAGILDFWNGFAKWNVRNRLTDRKRWSERRLDATGGPVVSLESQDEETDGNIGSTLVDTRMDVGGEVVARRTIEEVKSRMLTRYIAATGDRPIAPTLKSAIKAFVKDLRSRGRISPGEATDFLAAVRQQTSQMVLLGMEATAETNLEHRRILAACVECQIALATSLAVGDTLREAAEREDVSVPTARRLLAGMRRALRLEGDEEATAA